MTDRTEFTTNLAVGLSASSMRVPGGCERPYGTCAEAGQIEFNRSEPSKGRAELYSECSPAARKLQIGPRQCLPSPSRRTISETFGAAAMARGQKAFAATFRSATAISQRPGYWT